LIRPATLKDAPELLVLANQHELRVDPDFEIYPLSEIEEQITGVSEPGHPFLLEDEGIRAVVFIHPQPSRKRVEIDLFTIGSPEQTLELFRFALDYARETFPGFSIRSACNKLDAELLKIFESSGLKFYRDYYKLLKQPISNGFPELPAGVEVRSVSLETDAELLHELESKSFADHFGYVQVQFDDWLKERAASNTSDPKGSFIVYVNQQPAGFLFSSDFRADVQGGWVDKLGVLYQFRGQGLGKLLLQWGIAHAAQKGYTSIALGADTGNESGALELYFGLGFTEQLSWRAYSD
jgi:ribosomal protein S18 acetylase RimI-like enzyme